MERHEIGDQDSVLDLDNEFDELIAQRGVRRNRGRQRGRGGAARSREQDGGLVEGGRKGSDNGQ
jgi:hypothetical protein